MFIDPTCQVPELEVEIEYNSCHGYSNRHKWQAIASWSFRSWNPRAPEKQANLPASKKRWDYYRPYCQVGWAERTELLWRSQIFGF